LIPLRALGHLIGRALLKVVLHICFNRNDNQGVLVLGALIAVDE
jgi:hypothetical protein